ncbi:MAG: EamA family transporter [Candidatus Hydrogenedentes bacterium]|nr:EamA family transporter [Candidatus Hydrogenedentota bacterium]
MLRYYVIALIAVLLTALCQLLLKLGAVHGARHGSMLQSYFNFSTMTGYLCLLLVTVLNVYAYQVLPLKTAIIFLPLTFASVALISIGVLKERMRRSQVLGTLLIVIGIVLFNL